MHIDILGPLRIICGGEDVTPSAPKLRQVFTLLATCANTVVLHERFIEELWECEPPSSVTTTLQTYVYQLRKVRGLARPTPVGDGPHPELRTSRRGYTLLLPMNALDSFRFEDAVKRGSRELEAGRVADAATTLADALRLWRGPALADVEAGPILTAERLRLEELRRSALERRIEADLMLGRHTELVGELTGLVAQSPTNERIAAHLILALHRSNHRAEALRAYEHVRANLVDQLGLDPSAELQRLHRAVLRSDESLALPASAPAKVVVRTAPPCHLPQRSGKVIGRDNELAVALKTMSANEDNDGPPVVAVVGPPGVGKTALAVQAAYEARKHYPDGQLFAELTRPDGRPADLGEVLRGFMRALGVRDETLPRTTEELAYAFRSQTADRRILVVLDDLIEPDHVSPVSPIGNGCGVLLTGRGQLRCPCIRTTIDLGPLDTGDALELLGSVVGEHRVRQDPGAARELVALCDGLPSALRTCAEKLRTRPHWTLRRLIEWIDRGRAQGSTDPLNLRPSIERTYWSLTPDTREVFGLFTDLRADRLSAADVAEMLALDELDAEGLLETLVEVQLVDAFRGDEDPEFRYGCLPAIQASGRWLPLTRAS